MKFQTYDLNDGLVIVEGKPQFRDLWHDLKSALEEITDEDLIQTKETRFKRSMSLSKTISFEVNSMLTYKKWKKDVAIFNEFQLNKSKWIINYVKQNVGVNLCFKHNQALVQEILKLEMASRDNDIEKNMKLRLGVLITATEALRSFGGFDNSVTTFEKTKLHLKPLAAILKYPIIVIGLEPPETFKVNIEKGSNRKVGNVIQF